MKNVIFLGRKPSASKAIEHLLAKGINVKLAVAPRNEPYRIKLADTAKKNNIPVLFDDEKIYSMIEKQDHLVSDIDLVISYLFWNKIRNPLIHLSRLGCINFHPAPLPDYKSRAGYNTAILESKKSFGVSVHFIDSENFDSGPIIKVLKFPIDPEKENAFALEKKAQKKLFQLFQTTIDLFLKEKDIPTTENKGGLFLTLDQLEKLKTVSLTKDTPEEIDKKIRAFFFPPYTGAKIKIQDREFTLVNNEILQYINEQIKDSEN